MIKETVQQTLNSFFRLSAMRTLTLKGLAAMPPELAHRATILALKNGVHPTAPTPDPRLQVEVGGLTFANPLCMAAGFDKNAQVYHALWRMGFGAAEVGTLTPLPQEGNAPPRLFRLEEHQAVINRMGFNNCGHRDAQKRLQADKQSRKGILGINIGANKDAEHFVQDYITGMTAFYDLADYFTVNISSPNTPGLRDLQAQEALARLLEAVLGQRDVCALETGRRVPVFLKIAPDVSENELQAMCTTIQQHDLDALIISNTTLDRTVVAGHEHADQAGGLSGAPLFLRSTIKLAQARQLLGADFILVGVGGIGSGADAVIKLRAGANLIQLYSGLVYGGLGLIEDIMTALGAELDRSGLDTLSKLTSLDADQWAQKSI